MMKSKSGYYIVRYRLDDKEVISEILVFGKDAESVRKHMISLYGVLDIISITMENRDETDRKTSKATKAT